MDNPKLSICISTRNRARFLGETLDSIVGQLEPGVELVILDGASTDGTSELMGSYLTRYPAVRYCREQKNSGVDQDYDKAVGYARGTFCWLMTDDDLLQPGAVRHVMAAVDGTDLVIVNSEVRNLDFTELLEERRLHFVEDRMYKGDDYNQFCQDCANYMTFIGAIIVKREEWLLRDRGSYYGSDFIHLGVIFQKPKFEAIRVVAEPLISIRYGNASWSPRTFEIWAIKFPALVWSFPDLSDEARMAASNRYPWEDLKTLLYWRAVGAFSKPVFDKFLGGEAGGLRKFTALCISIFPGRLASALAMLYLGTFKRGDRLRIYDLVNGRHATHLTRLLARLLGYPRLIQA